MLGDGNRQGRSGAVEDPLDGPVGVQRLRDAQDGVRPSQLVVHADDKGAALGVRQADDDVREQGERLLDGLVLLLALQRRRLDLVGVCAVEQCGNSFLEGGHGLRIV